MHALRNRMTTTSEEEGEKMLLQCILICCYMTIALVKVSMGHYTLNSTDTLAVCVHWTKTNERKDGREVFLYACSVYIGGSINRAQARVSVTSNIFIGATFIYASFFSLNAPVHNSLAHACTLRRSPSSLKRALTDKQHDHIFIRLNGLVNICLRLQFDRYHIHLPFNWIESE